MEQTNLVVTPDGKTWDEVTRDVYYLGNIDLTVTASANNTGGWHGNASTPIYFDEFRGAYTGSNADHENWNKNWAIAYDRFICLKDGSYEILVSIQVMQSGSHLTSIVKNGSVVQRAHPLNVSNEHVKLLMQYTDPKFKRGDTIQFYGQYHGQDFAPTLTIKRI